MVETPLVESLSKFAMFETVKLKYGKQQEDVDDQRFMEMQRQTIERRAFLLKP
jgi:hypothetical protein